MSDISLSYYGDMSIKGLILPRVRMIEGTGKRFSRICALAMRTVLEQKVQGWWSIIAPDLYI